jgi:hypothetical protein
MRVLADQRQAEEAGEHSVKNGCDGAVVPVERHVKIVAGR